jgi:hypothetical protein
MMVNIQKSVLFLLALQLSLIAWPRISLAIDGATIARKVYDRNDGDTAYSWTEMQLIDKHGKIKSRTFVSVSKDFGQLRKSYTRFSSPAEIKGTVFLVWENAQRDDDQFLYLPALKRLRRIVSRQKKTRFVNSDFTYEDMQRKRPEESRHQLLRTERYDHRDCWVVESIPRPDTSQYQKWVSWIDKEYLLPLKAEYYSSRGELLKRCSGSNIKKIDGIWTILDIEMQDIQKKHTTRMLVKKVYYNRKVEDIIFTQSYAKKGR